MTDSPIYRRLSDERLADDVPAADPVDPPTELLPLVDPRPTWAGDQAGAEDLTHDDWRLRRTDNRLRPDDLALPQPPQDPDWRPDADR